MHGFGDTPERTPRRGQGDVELEHASGSVFRTTAAEIDLRREQIRHYEGHNGKDCERPRFIRDAIDPDNGLTLNPRLQTHKVLLELMDHPFMQRLRHISQLGTAQWVFPDATHTRFPHCLSSGDLAIKVVDALEKRARTEDIRLEIQKYGPAVVTACTGHDFGHFAPHSHLAEAMWFPNEEGMGAHEKVTLRMFREDEGFQHLLRTAIPKRPNLPDQVIGILEKSDDVPPWTWKLVSGGGWNIDRGDWVYRDSVHSGVQYGRYDRGMLIQRLQVTESGDLAVDERGVENIEAFFESRKHMYNSLYYHETSRVAFDMYCKCAERARELFRAGMPIHADPVMQQVLGADSSDELPLNTLLAMTEGWWESHVHAWAHDAQDPILKDFAERIVLRKPFKHFPDNDYNRSMLGKLVAEAGLDPNYYLLRIKPLPEKHKEDLDEALLVQRRDGTLLPLTQKSRLLEAFSKMRKNAETAMLAIPLEAFLTSPAMH